MKKKREWLFKQPNPTLYFIKEGFVHIQYKSHKCQSGASRHKQDFVKKNIKVSWKQKQLKQQLQTG